MFAGKRVLVTGAAGFLGTYLSDYLRSQDCLVFGLDKRPAHSTDAFEHFVIGDLAEAAERCLDRFEPAVVFHLAGSASVPDSVRDPFGDLQTTLPGTARLLAAAAKSPKPPKLVYFSSAAVYGQPTVLPIREDSPVRPLSPYGVHKAACEALLEHYARIYDLRVSILRIFSAYGEGLRKQFFWDFAERAFAADADGASQVSVLGTGDESRDFIHASDIAKAACLAALSPGEGVEVVNVAAGQATAISWAAERLLSLLGLDLAFRFQGVASAGTPTRWLGDTSRLAALGFRPERSLENRLPDLARWLAAEHQRTGA